MIPGINFAVHAAIVIYALALPIGLMIFFKKKYGCSLIPFFVGAGTMFVFAGVIEYIIHIAVFSVFPALTENLWLYAVYSGLMAGLFEETGRFLSMRFRLKKHYTNDHNALMYGAGHGGFEAVYLLGTAHINNMIYSVIINAGMEETILSQAANSQTAAQIRNILDTLKTADVTDYLFGAAERLPAVAAQIALSVMVWIAVTRPGKRWLYPLAIFIHALYDFAAVVINGLSGSAIITGLFIVAGAAVICFAAYKLWRDNKTKNDNNIQQGDMI